MDVALSRRIAAAFAHECRPDEQDFIVREANPVEGWTDLDPEVQELIEELEGRPLKPDAPLEMKLAALEQEGGVTASAHAMCTEEFCRNPLHPGPCKRWRFRVPGRSDRRRDTGEPAPGGGGDARPAHPTHLTGRSGASWKTNFTHALANDTGPNGVTVTDFDVHFPGDQATGNTQYHVAHGTIWRTDGISYLVEHPDTSKGRREARAQMEEVRRFHQRWLTDPDDHYTQGYFLAQGARPLTPAQIAQMKASGQFDASHQRVFATAGEGVMSIWETDTYGLPHESYLEEYLLHEHGHNVARVREGERLDYSEPWFEAARSDTTTGGPVSRVPDFTVAPGPAQNRLVNGTGFVPGSPFPAGVTEYGTVNPAEDFAEAVMMYRVGPIGEGTIPGTRRRGPIYFRDLFPARAAILDSQFPTFAARQQARISRERGGR